MILSSRSRVVVVVVLGLLAALVLPAPDGPRAAETPRKGGCCWR